MTNEKIYENVMGHKPNKEFGVKGSFSWDDIDALMNAVKNCSIPAVVERSELLNGLVDGINKEFETYAYLPDLEKYIREFNCG